MSLADASEAIFDPFEDTFGLAFNIDHPGNLILNDYLQFLPIAEQETALALVNLYETRRVSTFAELLSMNFNEHREVTLLALPVPVVGLGNIYKLIRCKLSVLPNGSCLLWGRPVDSGSASLPPLSTESTFVRAKF